MKKLLAMTLLAIPSALMAQQKAPIAQYWMSVETSAGMSMPGMGAMAGAAMGRRAQGGRSLMLDLGSQRGVDAPSASHEIPAGMNMGPSLPLETPRSGRSEYGETGELPKGRWLIYWGCGDNVRAGQPVVVDIATMAQGGMPKGFTARLANTPNPPSGRTKGQWPNQLQPKPVPDTASLVGDHTVRGNYTPDIRFSLTQTHDFMERVELSSAPSSGGGTTLRWKPVPNATGYSATAMSVEGNDIVFWSSSEVQSWAWELMDYIAPGEVARLIREKAVLTPQTTECTVPAEVVKKSGTPMANFIAYGPEANFGFPPRPKDPEWYAKVRFKSTASAILGEREDSPRGRAQQRRAEQPARTDADPSAAQQQPSQPQPANPVLDGVNILRGIFGR